jgi:hypothetical protein
MEHHTECRMTKVFKNTIKSDVLIKRQWCDTPLISDATADLHRWQTSIRRIIIMLFVVDN